MYLRTAGASLRVVEGLPQASMGVREDGQKHLDSTRPAEVPSCDPCRVLVPCLLGSGWIERPARQCRRNQHTQQSKSQEQQDSLLLIPFSTFSTCLHSIATPLR
jgi:hypothetical protein